MSQRLLTRVLASFLFGVFVTVSLGIYGGYYRATSHRKSRAAEPFPFSKSDQNGVPYLRMRDHLARFCEQDRRRVHDFLKQDPKKVSLNQWDWLVMNPLITGCQTMKRFGGGYNRACHVQDGQKYVCMDNFPSDDNDCLIYSFGISNDYSFEQEMQNLGCTVFAFDPTVSHKAKLGNRIYFAQLGVSKTTGTIETNGEQYLPLSDILKLNHHSNRTIFYLKMDVEGTELDGFPVWLYSGAFDNVNQFGIEIHFLDVEDIVRGLLPSFQELYRLGFKLVSFDLNACTGKVYNKPHYQNAEVVFQRQAKNSPISTLCNGVGQQ